MTPYRSPSEAAAQLKARRQALVERAAVRAAEQQAIRVADLEKATVTESQPIRVPIFEGRQGSDLEGKSARYRKRRAKRLVKEVTAHASSGCLVATKWLDKSIGMDFESEAGIVALSNAEYLLARHATGCPT